MVTDEQCERLARLAAFGLQLSTEGVGQWWWQGSGERPCNTQVNLPDPIVLPGFNFKGYSVKIASTEYDE